MEQSNKVDISDEVKYDLLKIVTGRYPQNPTIGRRCAAKNIINKRNLTRYDILKVHSNNRSQILGTNDDRYEGKVRFELLRHPLLSRCEITIEKLYYKLANKHWRIILREYDFKIKRKKLNI